MSFFVKDDKIRVFVLNLDTSVMRLKGLLIPKGNRKRREGMSQRKTKILLGICFICLISTMIPAVKEAMILMFRIQ